MWSRRRNWKQLFIMTEKEKPMPEIILNEVQAKIISEAREPIILTDAAGTVRIVSEPFDAIALAEYHRYKMSGIEEEGIPSEKVAYYLKALQAERMRLGHPLGDAYIEEFIARLEKANAA
jgi:hypothetical protein